MSLPLAATGIAATGVGGTSAAAAVNADDSITASFTTGGAMVHPMDVGHGRCGSETTGYNNLLTHPYLVMTFFFH